MRYGDLTFPEIRERAETGWLAVVPVGSMKQQGPHLPVDFDAWLAEHVALAAADQAARDYHVYALVLPAIPFGPVSAHRNFRYGNIHIPVKLHNALLYAALKSLIEQGFRHLVVWPGSEAHHLGAVIDQFNAEYDGRACVTLPALPYQAVWCELGKPDAPLGHADGFMTSLALFLRPDCVRTSRLVVPHGKPVNWADPKLDLTRHTNTGVVGDPTFASAELGRRLWDASVRAAAQILRDAAPAD